MGFYLRKSFRAGPIRFNLSKSGLGFSAGVTGARLGVTSRGRPYLHAGRGGLYVREYLDGGGRSRSAAVSAATAGAPAFASGPIVLHTDTGVTYGTCAAAGPDTTAPAVIAPRAGSRAGALFVASLVTVVVTIVGCSQPGRGQAIGSYTGLLAPVLLVAGLVVRARYRAGTRLGAALAARLVRPVPLTPEERRDLQLALADRRMGGADHLHQCRHGLLVAIDAVTRAADDIAAAAFLADAEALLALDDAWVRRAKLSAWRGAYLTAVADHELTTEEERALDRLRSLFAVEAGDVAEELAVVAELRAVREIRAGRLPVVASGKQLEPGEVCHFQGPGRLLKTRVIRTFQRDLQKYSVRGFAIDREGLLLITSTRLLFLDHGAVSIPLGRILDLEVDADLDLITLTRDGAATPVVVTTPGALTAGAILSALTKM